MFPIRRSAAAPVLRLTERRLGIIASLLALVGVARIGVLHLVKERAWMRPPARIDERWAPIRAALPGAARVGFVSDRHFTNPTRDRTYLEANYALAPHVLARDEALEYVVTDLPAPALEAFRAAGGYRTVATADGVTLVRRPGAP